MLCSGTYLMNPERRIHNINLVCNMEVPTATLATSPQIIKKLKSLENNLFSPLEIKAETAYGSVSVCGGGLREGRVGFITCSCCILPFNKLPDLIPNEVN